MCAHVSGPVSHSARPCSNTSEGTDAAPKSTVKCYLNNSYTANQFEDSEGDNKYNLVNTLNMFYDPDLSVSLGIISATER